jgi:hypothetical protein
MTGENTLRVLIPVLPLPLGSRGQLGSAQNQNQKEEHKMSRTRRTSINIKRLDGNPTLVSFPSDSNSSDDSDCDSSSSDNENHYPPEEIPVESNDQPRGRGQTPQRGWATGTWKRTILHVGPWELDPLWTVQQLRGWLLDLWLLWTWRETKGNNNDHGRYPGESVVRASLADNCSEEQDRHHLSSSAGFPVHDGTGNGSDSGSDSGSNDNNRKQDNNADQTAINGKLESPEGDSENDSPDFTVSSDSDSDSGSDSSEGSDRDRDSGPGVGSDYGTDDSDSSSDDSDTDSDSNAYDDDDGGSDSDSASGSEILGSDAESANSDSEDPDSGSDDSDSN